MHGRGAFPTMQTATSPAWKQLVMPQMKTISRPNNIGGFVRGREENMCWEGTRKLYGPLHTWLFGHNLPSSGSGTLGVVVQVWW